MPRGIRRILSGPCPGHAVAPGPDNEKYIATTSTTSVLQLSHKRVGEPRENVDPAEAPTLLCGRGLFLRAREIVDARSQHSRTQNCFEALPRPC